MPTRFVARLVAAVAENGAAGKAGAEIPGVGVFFGRLRRQLLSRPHRDVVESRSKVDGIDLGIPFDAGLSLFVESRHDSAVIFHVLQRPLLDKFRFLNCPVAELGLS